ncbi:MAG: hypothetical protein ABW216_19715 [Candidatus Rokuibacteriota bacterium]|jgi:hypothetical protein|nr:hypothetical protein [Patescibacteria group bacterium]
MATIARNIGAAGRRQRLLYGSISLVVGIAAAALLMTGAGGVSRGARLLLFLPFLGAALGLMQARDHTCVRLAAQGQRDLDRGSEAVADPWLMGQLKRQAREVVIEAVLAAAFLTGVALVLPG